MGRSNFAHTVVCDFEFIAGGGKRPDVVCLAYKIDEQPTQVIWRDERGEWTTQCGDQLDNTTPYPLGNDTLYVCFTQAELSCHLSLGWPLPTHVLDLNCELRVLTAGLKVRARGLLGFCEFFDMPAGDTAAKDAIRAVIMRGRPYSPEDKDQIIRYNASDVDALRALFDRVVSHVNFERGLHQGAFSKVSARMEHRGVPTKGQQYREIAAHWGPLRDALVPELDPHGVYVKDANGEWHLSHEQFENLLTKLGITYWPRTETGRLSLTSNVFHDMTKGVAPLEGLRQLKHMRDKMRAIKLAVGPDDRARTVLWPFQSKTGRTQPAASEFPFSPATWVRNLIAPEPGMAISYIDWSSMEFLIAAALSGDPLMLDFYYSGDPYLSFAKRVGAAPKDATKKSHGPIREIYKIGLLAIQYGISAAALAGRLGVSEIAAREMISQHRALFRVYWNWATDWLSWALNHGVMWTAIDWRCAVGETQAKERSIINWPVCCGQAAIAST